MIVAEEQPNVSIKWKDRLCSTRGLMTGIIPLVAAIVIIVVVFVHIGSPKHSEGDNLALDSESENTTDFNLVTFMNNELLTEAWVDPQYDMINEGSPLAGFTDEDQLLSLGAREIATVFDMVDRQEMKGVATTAFSTFQEIAAWYSTQPPSFTRRYQLATQPVPLGRGILLGSPGLPIGQFNTSLLGGVLFTDMSYTVRAATFPTCDPGNVFNPPPTSGGTGSYLFMLMVRSVLGFYKAGQTVRRLTDTHGNIYYGLSRRTNNPQGQYGFTYSTVVLSSDERTSCLRSSHVPSNVNLTDRIICKQLQLVDESGNTYLFMRGPATLQGEDRIIMSPVKHVAGPAGTLMSCHDLSLTDPLV
eukprot:gene28486-34390_t